jgi:hypothetical protein
MYQVLSKIHWRMLILECRPSHPCEHSRINILQWILTKLGTYLVLKRIWNPIDFQGQRSRSSGQILKDVDSRVFTRMLRSKILTWLSWPLTYEVMTLKINRVSVILRTKLIFKVIGQGHRVKFLLHSILVNTLESRSFNGFWPNLVHT